MAGQVFEWTATACPGDPARRIVKGGAWDDYPRVTCAAARHCRPHDMKHVLIGFRCVDNETKPADGRSSPNSSPASREQAEFAGALVPLWTESDSRHYHLREEQARASEKPPESG